MFLLFVIFANELPIRTLALHRPRYLARIIESGAEPQLDTSTSKMTTFHFAVTDNYEQKAALEESFHREWDEYVNVQVAACSIKLDDYELNTQSKDLSYAKYLAKVLIQEVRWVIACTNRSQSILSQSLIRGYIASTALKFMSSALLLGSGPIYTISYLFLEVVLGGIPFEVTQMALITLAKIETKIKQAPRQPHVRKVHYYRW
jgi:hypothetical protein